MKKIFYVLICFVLACSCNGREAEYIPEGMVKVYFGASTENTKTVLNGRSVEWVGNEAVRIWYKDSGGNTKQVTAKFESVSGTSARLSALIPADSNMDEFYAEINGVSDSGSSFYPWGSKGPRTITPTTQQAVPNSFDPAACALGARWKKSQGNASPFFSFYNLHNLLAISVDNQTGKTIDSITLTSSSDLACKNYWLVQDDGTIKHSFSAAIGKSIELVGVINGGKADYCFAVPVKNNNGSNFKLDDMHLLFHCTTGEYYEVQNPNTLELNKNSCSKVGNFVITPSKLYYPKGAPFGTYWGKEFVQKWNEDGFSSGKEFIGLASFDTRPEVSAVAKASTTSSIEYSNGGNEKMKGKFYFEFVTADSGKGLLSFWSALAADNHSTSIKKNGKEVKTITTTTGNILTECEIDVVAGDVISIVYNNPSSNASLYCGGVYNTDGKTIDRRIRWDDATLPLKGGFSSPEDLSEDDQSSFFKEI